MLAGHGALAQATSVTSLDPPPTTVLDGDKRLDQQISVQGVGLSMAQLLAELSQKGLTLHADSDCADQKVQIHITNKSLRSVMTGLAKLLPGTWETPGGAGSGYELSMGREASAYRAAWWDTFLAERGQALAIQQEHILQAMQNPPASPPDAQGATAPSDTDKSQSFFNALPTPLQERVAEQIDDTPFYQTSLQDSSNGVELATAMPISSLPDEAQILVQQGLDGRSIRPVGAQDLHGAVIVFANDGIGVFANLLSADGHDMGNLFDASATGGFYVPGLTLDQSWLPSFVDQNSFDVPLSWQTLADYQRKRFWHDDPPPPDPKLPVSTLSLTPTRNVDWLNWVGTKAAIDYIADYYSLPQRPMTVQEMDAPLTRPLKQELDAQAATRDISWEKTQKNIYLFRNNRWYRDDGLEVPNSVATQIKADLTKYAETRSHVPGAST